MGTIHLVVHGVEEFDYIFFLNAQGADANLS